MNTQTQIDSPPTGMDDSSSDKWAFWLNSAGMLVAFGSVIAGILLLI